jgi:peptide/nickel transport system substrate-binding protein
MSMSRRKKKSFNPLIIVAIVIVVAIVGGAYYFLVYIPQFNEERSRLLTLNTHADPQTLDPALAFDTSSMSIIVNVYDRLVQNERGTTDVFEPSLATDWETPDSMTYIFNLRDDVMFHDNTPFNAESVKFSFERVLASEGPSYILAMINEIEILDTYKVKITLHQEFTPFFSALAHPVASIVSPSAVETHEGSLENNPVGTGPFIFEDWKIGNNLTLTANEDYFKGAPAFKKVVFKSILEASGRRTALERGDIDVVFTAPPAVTADDLTSLEKNADIRIYKGVSSSIEFLGFNMLKSPLNDSRVRDAISYAIDYDGIINDVFGGRAERLWGPLPPGIFGYKNETMKQRDIAKATQILEDAGYSSGFELTLTYNIENLERRKVAEKIRDSLAEIDITVSIKGLDWQSAISEYLSMGHELFLNGWTPDFFDPDAYLSPQYHSIMGWANVFGLNNPEIDALIDDGLLTTDQTARERIYQEVQDIIVEDMPCIFLYVPSIYDCVRFNVENWVHHPLEVIDIYELYTN